MPYGPAGSGSGGGGLSKLFDSTLGAPAANIDTLANGVAAGHADLTIYVISRTVDAGATANIRVTLNGDTGANYDLQFINGVATTAAANTVLASANWQAQTHGAGGTAGYPGIMTIIIPAYAATTFNKVATILTGNPDGTAANEAANVYIAGWRSTAAINQVTVTGATANLAAGSRLVVYGAQ